MLTILAVLTVLSLCPQSRAETRSVREYARQLVLNRWNSQAQWDAFDTIIRRESGWNPCAYYPSSRDCHYSGGNSCGLAQRNPCPGWMRGRLWETRYAQVRDAIGYMAGRYGSPLAALAYWNAHRSY